VGLDHHRVIVVGEAKWSIRPMGSDILDDLRNFKLPTLARSGFTLTGEMEVVLASRSGFTRELLAQAGADLRLHLVEASTILDELQ
jgi:hypothetical protein